MGSLILSWNRGDGPRTGFYTDDEVNGVYFLRVNNLKEHSIDLLDVKYIHREVHEKTLQRTKVTRGDVIFAISGTKDNLGTVSIIPDFIQEANLNSALVRLDLDTNKVNKDFFCYFFDLNVARRQIQFIGKGAAQNNLNNEEISQIKIPLPPLKIQISLVAEIEAARQTRKQKLAQADELFYSTDTYLLEKLGIRIFIKPNIDDNQCFAVKRKKVGIRLDPFYNLPEHQVLESSLSDCPYKVLAIGDERVVREIVEGRITPKPEFYSESQEDPIFLRAQNIEKGYLNFSDAKRLTREAFEAENKAILLDGDIVLTIDGVLLGIAAVHLSGAQDCCISNHMVRLRHGIEVDPEYIVWFLNSSAGQRQIKRGITGSAIPGIRTDAIERILVPIPPMDIQRSLVVEIEKRRAEAQRLRQEAKTEWEAAKTRFEHKLLGEKA